MVLLCPAFAVTACADDLGTDYKEVSEEDSKLLFYGPGLEGGYRQFLVGQDKYYARRTSATYGPPAGDMPHALLYLAEMPPGRHFSRLADVVDNVEAWGWFKDKTVTKGAKGATANRIGRVEYVPVVADGIACVVWREVWGPQYALGRGTMLLDGYYCKGEGPMMTAAEAESIVKLVGHREHGPIDPPPGWEAATQSAAHAQRARKHYRAGDYDKAIADLTEAIRIDPENALYHHRRGWIWQRKEDYDRAIADFEEAIRLRPDFADAHESAGYAYLKKKRFDIAIRYYDTAVSLAPTDGGTYNNRCWAYGLMRRPQEALKDCNESLRLKPDVPATLDSRALAYWLMGDLEKARRDLERAREVSPKFTPWEKRFREFETLF